jgi:hypothetical protein
MIVVMSSAYLSSAAAAAPVSRRRAPRPVSQPVESTPPPPSRLDSFVNNYLRSAPVVGQAAAAGNIFNPFPSISEAALQGRLPTGGEAGLDAGFLAASFLPMGKAASQLNALVKRLNKSTDVADFITPSTMQSVSTRRPNDANEGLFRPGAQSFDYGNVPDAASPYTFGLVPTERLLPLREFDRMAEPAGQGVFGPDNVRKLSEHLASGGKLSDPLAVGWDPGFNWGYLAEGNHRLAAAEALGLEQLPTTVWRMPSVLKYLTDTYTPNPAGVGPRFDYGKNLPPVGRRMEIDTNQLRRDSFGDFPRTVGDYYVPPTMNPYLFPDLRP